MLIQSGMIGRDEMEKGVSFGVEDYLVKPFSRNELYERMGAIMERDEFQDNAEARRTCARARTLKSGQIVYNSANCVADCLILNMSDSGAALQVSDVIDLPTRVTLKEKRGKSYQCEVCWHHGKKLGVRFV